MSPVDLQILKDLLIKHEGLKQHAYKDTVGYITVGVGRNLTTKGLSNEEVDLLLLNDINECLASLAVAFPWFLSLDSIRKIALCDMRFNLGMQGLLGFKEFLKSMERGDYQLAAQQMLESLWATQVGQRAVELSTMIATGVL